MPAPTLVNHLSGGTDGVQVTNANSGGEAGDAFSTTSPLALYGTTTAITGHTSLKLSNILANTTCNWTKLGSLTNNLYIRAYLYLTAFPASNSWLFFRIVDNIGGTCCYLKVNAGTGILQGTVISLADAVSLGTVPIPLNQWVRVEYRVLASTTVGETEWRLYTSPHSTVIRETRQSTGLVLTANCDEIHYGLTGASFPTLPFLGCLDEVAVSMDGWIGPAVLPSPARAFE
jgi:hypothetical protein